MIELNLLPDLKKDFIKSQRMRNQVVGLSILSMIISVGLVVLAGLYVYAVQAVQLSLVNSDITAKTKELKEVKEIDKYLTIKNQLGAIDSLHADKTAYSRLMSALPTLNPSAPNSIQLTTMQVDEGDNTITFSGIAPNYEALGIFKATLEGAEVSFKPNENEAAQKTKLFTDVITQSSAIGQDTNGTKNTTFTIQAHYDVDAIKFSSESVSVTVPAGAVTGSNPLFQGGTQ